MLERFRLYNTITEVHVRRVCTSTQASWLVLSIKLPAEGGSSTPIALSTTPEDVSGGVVQLQVFSTSSCCCVYCCCFLVSPSLFRSCCRSSPTTTPLPAVTPSPAYNSCSQHTQQRPAATRPPYSKPLPRASQTANPPSAPPCSHAYAPQSSLPWAPQRYPHSCRCCWRMCQRR